MKKIENYILNQLFEMKDATKENQILKAIKKGESACLSFAKFLIKNNQQIDDRLLIKILNQPTVFDQLIKFLSKSNIDPEKVNFSEFVLNKISENDWSSMIYAIYLIKNNEFIDRRFLESIAKDGVHSRMFAHFLIENNIQVNKIILSGISQDIGEAYRFAKFLIENNKEVDKIILNGIADDAHFSFNFAKFLIVKNKQVPEIILSGIKKDPISNSAYNRFLRDKDKLKHIKWI